jgi:thioredoxin-dependent peroxiredoxin
MALKVHQQAPDFSLPSTDGSLFTLSESARGQGLILYFYPKDFTPGCTKEACEFRDQFELFRDLEIPVLGISMDSVVTHQKFRETHRLPFHLLADTEGEVCKLYDALIPIVKMPKRVTYLLDKNHKIAAVYSQLFGAEEHVRQMITQMQQRT